MKLTATQRDEIAEELLALVAQLEGPERTEKSDRAAELIEALRLDDTPKSEEERWLDELAAIQDLPPLPEDANQRRNHILAEIKWRAEEGGSTVEAQRKIADLVEDIRDEFGDIEIQQDKDTRRLVGVLIMAGGVVRIPAPVAAIVEATEAPAFGEHWSAGGGKVWAVGFGRDERGESRGDC